MQGLIGQKLGMTQVVDADGHMTGVTVIRTGPCVVIQRKTKDKDGYEAAQLGFGDLKESRTKKPALTKFKKLGCTPKRHLAEFALDTGDEIKAGDVLTVSIFDKVPYVDVTAITKGKGFQGPVRRHGMSGGPITHGGHSKRRIGSIGQNSYPARVRKGHRMPGHMGHVRVTQQNLELVQVKADENLILVSGAVPGPTGGVVYVRKALKRKEKRAKQEQGQKEQKGAKKAAAEKKQ